MFTGNATQAALRSGCRTYNAAHVQASRWLQRPTIQNRILELREKAFQQLQQQVTQKLTSVVGEALGSGISTRQTQRAITLMDRLGVFSHHNKLTEEIADLEERYGSSIDTILQAMSVMEAELAVVDE